VSEKRTIRVGIVGSGFMAKAHTAAYNNLTGLYWPDLPHVEKARMAGLTVELAREGAARWGWADHTDDWRRVTRGEDVDLVDIVTPNNAHAEIAIDAARHDKSILCEKPLAHDLATAREMYDAIAAAGVVNQVAFVYRAWPAMQFARRLIQEGALGTIMRFDGWFHQDYALDTSLPAVWRLRRSQAGAGSIGDVGSHVVDLARYLVGEIARVCARSRTFICERPAVVETGESAFHAVDASMEQRMVEVDVDDATDVLCEFDAGVIGTIRTNWVAAGHKLDLGFEVGGDRGAVRFTWQRPNELELYSGDDPRDARGFKAVITGPMHPGGEAFWPVPGAGLGYGDAIVISMRELLSAVDAGGPAVPDFLDGLRCAEVIDAVLRSDEERAWVSVERQPAVAVAR
jgi:predicted dehydrogenase